MRAIINCLCKAKGYGYCMQIFIAETTDEDLKNEDRASRDRAEPLKWCHLVQGYTLWHGICSIELKKITCSLQSGICRSALENKEDH